MRLNCNAPGPKCHQDAATELNLLFLIPPIVTMGCSASKALESEPEPAVLTAGGHRSRWSVARSSGRGSVRPRKAVSSRVARGSTLRHPKSLLVNVNTHQTSTFADIVRQNRAKSANEEGPNRSHSLGYVDKLKKVTIRVIIMIPKWPRAYHYVHYTPRLSLR